MPEIEPTLLLPSKKNKISHDSLKGKYRKNWVETAAFLGDESDAELSMSGTSHVGNSFSDRRFIHIMFGIAITLVLIVFRLVYIQLFKGDEYRHIAEGNRQRILPIPAERGLIFDARGRQLVENIPNFSLVLTPQDLPKDKKRLEKLVYRLSELTGLETDGILSLIEEYDTYRFESIVIKDDINYETALAIYIQSSDFPGLYIQRGSKRLYIDSFGEEENSFSDEWYKHSLSHILGYEGKISKNELEYLHELGYLASDSIGKAGIEKNYEKELRGVYGRRRVEVNASGKEQRIIAELDPSPGAHAHLSLDALMQIKLESILADTLKKNNKKRASAIALDPRNGEIKAMVSLPSFDNNAFSGGIDPDTYQAYLDNENQPLFNRAIGGTYPSGSSIKPAIALAALEEGIIQPLTAFISTGGIRVGPWFFPDWQAGGHGRTNVRYSLAWSVNTFYYYIGGGYANFVGLGLEKMVSYLSNLKFGERLGVDIPGEAKGFLPSREWKKEALKEPWYIGDTYNLSIGQGHLLVTPLQIAEMTSIIANNGVGYTPHLLRSIEDPETGEFSTPSSSIDSFRPPFSDQAYITVRAGMKDCVDYGSCRLLKGLSFAAAGKTGTAQWNKTKENHAWFTSFAPYESPELVLTILVEEGEEGSRMAAPVAYEFYKWWWNYRLDSI